MTQPSNRTPISRNFAPKPTAMQDIALIGLVLFGIPITVCAVALNNLAALSNRITWAIDDRILRTPEMFKRKDAIHALASGDIERMAAFDWDYRALADYLATSPYVKRALGALHNRVSDLDASTMPGGRGQWFADEDYVWHKYLNADRVQP